ncbi:Fe(3+) dicitrate transport protein FecA precursor [compost metagenome]
MRCRLTPLATAVRTLMLGFTLVSFNQTAIAAQVIAEQAGVRSYDIAPGSLDRVLGQFGQQAGVMVAVDSQLSNGLQSPGLRGQFGVDQALAQLIAGAGSRPGCHHRRYRLLHQRLDQHCHQDEPVNPRNAAVDQRRHPPAHG